MPGEPLIAGAGGDLRVPVAGDQQVEDSLMALTQTNGLVASTQSAASDTPARRTGAIASTLSASVIALRLKYSRAAPMAAWPGHQEAARGRPAEWPLVACCREPVGSLDDAGDFDARVGV